jgi:hypothetical protein
MTREEAILEEYKVLHEQAAAIKERRDSLLTVTLGVFTSLFGAFVAIASAADTQASAPRLVLPFFLALYLVHIASCLLMRSHQQHLRRILNYIRTEIEPKIPGLNWSTYLAGKSLKASNRGGLRGIGWFYLLLWVTPLTLLAITPRRLSAPEIIVCSALVVISGLLALDMRFAYTKSWGGDVR